MTELTLQICAGSGQEPFHEPLPQSCSYPLACRAPAHAEWRNCHTDPAGGSGGMWLEQIAKLVFINRSESMWHPLLSCCSCTTIPHWSQLVWNNHALLWRQVDEWVTPPFVVLHQIPLRHHCGRSDKIDAAGLEYCWPDNTTKSIFAPSEWVIDSYGCDFSEKLTLEAVWHDGDKNSPDQATQLRFFFCFFFNYNLFLL